MKRAAPQQAGEWALLEMHLPGRPPAPLGILLINEPGQLHVKLRSDWPNIVPDDEIEIWRELGQELQERAREHSAKWVLDWLDDAGSHVLQVGTRQEVQLVDADATLDILYGNHIAGLCGNQRTERNAYTPCPGRRPPSLANATERRPHRRKWAHAALAATLLLTAAVVSHLRSIGSRPSLRPVKITRQHSAPALISDTPYQLTLQIASVQQPRPASRRKRAKIRRLPVPQHKRFQFELLSFNPPARQSIYIEPPPAFIDSSVIAAAILPFSLPEAPQFRPRHGPFMQLISAVTLPFRLLFSHHQQTANSL